MSSAPDPKVAKLLADLDAVRAALDAAQAALSTHLLGFPVRSGCVDDGDLVPLKTAAAAWGISEDAALRRARRGHGVKRFGRWLVPSALVEKPRKAGGQA